MTYNITCPECGKELNYSTRNADIFRANKVIFISWDCKHCKNEIIGEYLYGRNR